MTILANLLPKSVFVGCLISVLLISIPLNGPLAFAQSKALQADPRVAEFLANINRNLVALMGTSEADSNQICERIVSSSLNIDVVAQRAGSRMWTRMSQQQRTAYRRAVVRRATRDCVSQNRDNDGQPLAFVGVRQGTSGDRLLATRSETPPQSHTVIWRLREDNRRLLAVDILFDGRSAALTFRGETNTLLDRLNDNIDEVIKAFGQ